MTDREKFLSGHKFNIKWVTCIWGPFHFDQEHKSLLCEEYGEKKYECNVTEVTEKGFLATNVFVGSLNSKRVPFSKISFIES